jgi:hypothetical protein
MANTSGVRRPRSTWLVGVLAANLALTFWAVALNDSVVAQQDSGRAALAGSKQTHNDPVVSQSKILDSLVNQNIPPAVRRGSEPVFREDYDWTERDRVLKALDRVADRAEELWPTLVEHLTDDRYCITVELSEETVNLSVGSICCRIISNNLAEAYYRCLPKDSEVMLRRLEAPDVASHGSKSLKKWCDERKGRKLYELQVESSEWAIRTIRGLSGVSEEERKQAVNSITKMIKSLNDTKRAVTPPRFITTVRESWYLPGPERSDESPKPGKPEENEKAERDPKESRPQGKGEGIW